MSQRSPLGPGGLASMPASAAQNGTPARKDLHRNMLKAMRPPQLQHEWAFWHDRNTSQPHPEGTAYGDRLVCLQEKISDVKTFWEVMNHFSMSTLQMRDSVHFFKRNVKPAWEDPRNVRGGAWTFRVPKADSGQFWQEVLLMAIGEQLQEACVGRDDICGISVSVRFNSNLIMIWNRDGSNKESIDSILKAILSLLSESLKPKDTHYYYKKHSDHPGYKEAIAASPVSVSPGDMTSAEGKGTEKESAGAS